MLLLIASLMLVVGAFLIRGVRSFYQREFYDQMHNVFSVNTELVDDLRSAAAEENGAKHIAEMLAAFSGPLGIDAGRRNYYVLDIHPDLIVSQVKRSRAPAIRMRNCRSHPIS